MGQNPSRQHSPPSFNFSSPARSFNGLLQTPSNSPSSRTSRPYGAIPVIIKMIRADRTGSAVAISEFDMEEQLLSNMTHPNIVQLLGSGKYPRKFLVLELLEGGTLSQALVGSSAISRLMLSACMHSMYLCSLFMLLMTCADSSVSRIIILYPINLPRPSARKINLYVCMSLFY